MMDFLCLLMDKITVTVVWLVCILEKRYLCVLRILYALNAQKM